MAYAMMSCYGKDNRSISAAAAMLRGFHSVYPLTTIERKHLRLLIAARISCSATLGAYSYQQNPENKYLLLHAEPAWNALELIWGARDGTTESTTAFDKVFDRACDCSGVERQGIISCSDITFPDPSVIDDLRTIREIRDIEEATPSKRMKTSDEKPSITFVTGNKKKLEEVKRILSPSSGSRSLPFQILNQKIDLPELQGDVLEIAREKCALAAKEVGSAVITEDTSLCFNALQDMPGPYIKWFLDRCGHTGLNDMISFSEDKSGYAQTVVGFCLGPGNDVVVFDGRTKGTIVPARGPLDFGWDPIFQPDEGSGLTYAEMSKENKDAISHRSRAFSKLRDYLLQQASN